MLDSQILLQIALATLALMFIAELIIAPFSLIHKNWGKSKAKPDPSVSEST